MSKLWKKIVESIPNPEIDIKKNYKTIRKVQEAVSAPKIKPLYKFLDETINVKGYDVPVRVFATQKKPKNVIIYFHGGGWVTGNIDTYTKLCHNLAKMTNSTVLSVDYRLAPEWKFPVGLNDCYQVVKYVIQNASKFKIDKSKIIIMGDSAGGNIAAAVSLRRRDRLQTIPYKQILIYPAVIADHDVDMFPSIKANKKNITLSLKEINDYIDLYKKKDSDVTNPYMSPLYAYTLVKQPKTLIVTAELDILRDEGEAYGQRLNEAGNDVRVERINEVGHGFFSSQNSKETKQVYKIINEFLSE